MYFIASSIISTHSWSKLNTIIYIFPHLVYCGCVSVTGIMSHVEVTRGLKPAFFTLKRIQTFTHHVKMIEKVQLYYIVKHKFRKQNSNVNKRPPPPPSQYIQQNSK